MYCEGRLRIAGAAILMAVLSTIRNDLLDVVGGFHQILPLDSEFQTPHPQALNSWLYTTAEFLYLKSTAAISAPLVSEAEN